MIAANDRDRWKEDPHAQAPRGEEIGRAFCTCTDAYHVSWGVLRAAGYRSTLSLEEPVLGPLLSRTIGTGMRVLIAGAADTGLLCVTGRALGHATADVTVLDCCPAPLRLIEEFVAERGVLCRTRRADLTQFTDVACWDVVLAHYTLSFVEPDRRPDVLRRLARSLTPAGTLICSEKNTFRATGSNPPEDEAVWRKHPRLGAPIRARFTPMGPEDLKRCLPEAGLKAKEEIDTSRYTSLPDENDDVTTAMQSAIITAARAE